MTVSRRRFLLDAGKGASLAAAMSATTWPLANAAEITVSPDAARPGMMTVGAASVDITCEPGPELAGFLARVQPSTNVRTHLFARALYLAKDAESLLWLSVDTLGFTPEIVARIKTELSKRLAIEPWRILVAATHTHSAPSASRLSCIGEYHDEYVETRLVPGMMEATCKAKRSSESCCMVETTGEVDLSYDRRNKPTKHTEKRVPAVGWKRPDGSFKAVLIGYTMHPTCYTGGDIAAEWPGAVADAVHETFSPETEPFVVQGACGNINYTKRNISDEEMREIGQAITRSVAERLKTSEPVAPYFAIRARRMAMLLEVENESGIDAFLARHRKNFAGNAKALKACDIWERWARNELATGGRDFVDAEVAAVALGRRVFVTAPFETLSWINPELAKHTSLDCFALGYTNGCYNYLPHDAAYDEGGYSPDDAHLWYRNFRCRRGELERLAQHSAALAELTASVAMPDIAEK